MKAIAESATCEDQHAAELAAAEDTNCASGSDHFKKLGGTSSVSSVSLQRAVADDAEVVPPVRKVTLRFGELGCEHGVGLVLAEGFEAFADVRVVE